MGTNNFTEVHSRSWFNRLGGAFKGIVVGAVLVLAGFFVLFWNEGRAVERYKTLMEGGGAVLSILSDQVDEGNQDRLVHLSGRATTKETLEDKQTGIRVEALRLIRQVKMFQWHESSRSESKKKLGGGEETITTYSYEKNWDEQLINSQMFKSTAGHENPVNMVMRSKTISAGVVEVGAFTLPHFFVEKLSVQQPIAPEVDPGFSLVGKDLHRVASGYYLGANPNTPQVGDLIISYFAVLPTNISLVAKQWGNSFQPYKTRAGGSIALISEGDQSADQMFAKAQQSNTFLTWVLRFAGFVLMVAGLSMILSPLVVFADVVPAVGSILGVGTRIISMLVAALLSLITISISWFYYRPLWGIGFLGIAVIVAFLTIRKVKKAEPVGPPPLPPNH